MDKTILYVMMLAVLATGVFAATATINRPTSGIIAGNFNFNVTIDGSEFDNCTIQLSSASTANTSYGGIGTVDNATSAANATPNALLNGTLNTRLVEDATNYNVRAICYNATNATNSITSAVISSITVDNTVPSTPTITAPASASSYSNDSIIFQVGVTGANTTACTLFFVGQSPSTATQYTMTHSANTCTSTNFQNVPNGIYTWYARASDGTNLSDTSQVRVEFQNGNKKKSLLLTPAQVAQATSGGTNTNNIVKVIAVGLVIYAVYSMRKK